MVADDACSAVENALGDTAAPWNVLVLDWARAGAREELDQALGRAHGVLVLALRTRRPETTLAGAMALLAVTLLAASAVSEKNNVTRVRSRRVRLRFGVSIPTSVAETPARP